MKQDVFPVGQGARKRRSQWLAFGIFKLLSYSIVLILFAILGFIIYKEEFYKLKYCSTVVYMVPRA